MKLQHQLTQDQQNRLQKRRALEHQDVLEATVVAEESSSNDMASALDYNYVTSATEEEHDEDDDNTSVTLDDDIVASKSPSPFLSEASDAAGRNSVRSALDSAALVASKESSSLWSSMTVDKNQLRKRTRNYHKGGATADATLDSTTKSADMYQLYQRLLRYAFSCSTTSTFGGGSSAVTVEMEASVPSIIVGNDMELYQSCVQLVSNAIYNTKLSVAQTTTPTFGMGSSYTKKYVRLLISLDQSQDNQNRNCVGKLLVECEEDMDTDEDHDVDECCNEVQEMAMSLGGSFGIKRANYVEDKKKKIVWFAIPCKVPPSEHGQIPASRAQTIHDVDDFALPQMHDDSGFFPNFNRGLLRNPPTSSVNRVTPNLAKPTITLPALPPLPPSLGGMIGSNFSVIFDQFDDGPNRASGNADASTAAAASHSRHGSGESSSSGFAVLPSVASDESASHEEHADQPLMGFAPTQAPLSVVLDQFNNGPIIANTSSGFSIIPPPRLHLYRPREPQQRREDDEFSGRDVDSEESMPSRSSIFAEESQHYGKSEETASTTRDETEAEEEDEDEDDHGPSQFMISEGSFRFLVR